MPKLIIDGQAIDADPGETVLEAARRIGIEIPTLCYLEGFEAGASCMVCAVKLKHNGQFIPACASRVVDGMEIECEAEEVREARRMALELLFSDHLGDCLSPCQRICPAHLGIPAVLRQVREGELGLAAATVRHDLAMANVLCRVCHRPCESGCRRGAHDEPVAIADLVIHSLDTERAAGQARVPAMPAERGKSVAVVGSGFTGLSAAWFLRQQGFACTVIEARETAGGTIRDAFPDLPDELLESEVDLLSRFGIEMRTAAPVDGKTALDTLCADFDAVLLATGEGSTAAAESMGLETDGAKIASDKDSMMSSRKGVFVAGRAVRPGAKPVACVADGKAAALCIGQFLEHQPVRRPPKPFSCFIGKIDGAEMEGFLQDANVGGRDNVAAPDVDIDRAIEESHRCVQCNCPKIDTCKLRELAIDYKINLNRFNTGERIRFQRNVEHPLVTFEPGKCIRCGNCVKVASDHQEQLGLTFIGRGFDVHVGVPFDESLDRGLLEVARKVVEACPVGALTLKDPSRNFTA
jgi:ferredoxin